MRILLTNDDGIDAPGLNVLRRRLEARVDKYEVTVVAPASNRSGSGMAKTRGDFGVVQRGPRAYAVLGTPADCVIAALGGILDERPDLVVSGMNDGANLGQVALSSGTVGAAMTAAIAGLPAIAVSVGGTGKGPDRTLEVFPDAAALTERIIESVMAQPGALGAGTVLNVNYPALPRSEIRGVRAARQAALTPRKRSYGLVRAPDLPHGRHRWVVTQTASVQPEWLGTDDEDVRAFVDAWVTVTPMDGDWTDANKMGQISDLLRALPSHAPRP